MSGKSDQREIMAKSKRGDHRISTRTGVEILAEVREPGLGRIEATIMDLSMTGFRMRCMTRLTGEKNIFMGLPSFAAIESKICWIDGDIFGCEFVQSLHPAVFDHIVSKYPTLKQAG
ncbi:PilZ domain-containing protein [Parasphingorhabdus cellanae]|uniref:PilZ domain-containing protein n=1 Tax=Parasphingorhabdus cellanae TaxID=2806553 RepID=A0ABX7T554_9SPHN|nr:PilZ domain-containing protein [Parasphingorhabdus cellanae]QTD55619.1 PilZ domain-containing protein [Parasphingorhabdus cellanae]